MININRSLGNFSEYALKSSLFVRFGMVRYGMVFKK